MLSPVLDFYAGQMASLPNQSFGALFSTSKGKVIFCSIATGSPTEEKAILETPTGPVQGYLDKLHALADVGDEILVYRRNQYPDGNPDGTFRITATPYGAGLWKLEPAAQTFAGRRHAESAETTSSTPTSSPERLDEPIETTWGPARVRTFDTPDGPRTSYTFPDAAGRYPTVYDTPDGPRYSYVQPDGRQLQAVIYRDDEETRYRMSPDRVLPVPGALSSYGTDDFGRFQPKEALYKLKVKAAEGLEKITRLRLLRKTRIHHLREAIRTYRGQRGDKKLERLKEKLVRLSFGIGPTNSQFAFYFRQAMEGKMSHDALDTDFGSEEDERDTKVQDGGSPWPLVGTLVGGAALFGLWLTSSLSRADAPPVPRTDAPGLPTESRSDAPLVVLPPELALALLGLERLVPTPLGPVRRRPPSPFEPSEPE
jgi:hypothetical protein